MIDKLELEEQELHLEEIAKDISLTPYIEDGVKYTVPDDWAEPRAHGFIEGFKYRQTEVDELLTIIREWVEDPFLYGDKLRYKTQKFLKKYD